MKKIILMVILICGIVSAYELPKYIANPDTGECKYYFAGDAAHFNPRPENFTIDIGAVTDYSSVEDACGQWKCKNTKGIWQEECKCPVNTVWINETGCAPTGEGPVFTEYELCKNSGGVWAAGTCTCTVGIWDNEKGCLKNGTPVSKFDSKSTGFAIWFFAIIIVLGIVFRNKLFSLTGKIRLKKEVVKNESEVAEN